MKKPIIFSVILILCTLSFFSFVKEEKPLLQDEKPVGTNLGNKAPDIKLLSPEGKEITLYSLKGKMVLIDFWASWCGYCRRENPTLVKAYKKYKDSSFKEGKGFTVYGVSLDQDKSKWVNAIQKDSLIWENHVSDLKGWGSEVAALYGVRGIPKNFLINGDGIIVAVSLRGPALEEELEKIAIKEKSIEELYLELQQTVSELDKKLDNTKNIPAHEEMKKKVKKIKSIL